MQWSAYFDSDITDDVSKRDKSLLRGGYDILTIR